MCKILQVSMEFCTVLEDPQLSKHFHPINCPEGSMKIHKDSIRFKNVPYAPAGSMSFNTVSKGSVKVLCGSATF